MWKQIPGFSSYLVNASGKIFSLKSEKVLKTDKRVNNSGYETVCLGAEVKAVHWCVAVTFLGPSRGRQVHHINGNRRDNRLFNLEWATRKENMAHARKSMEKVWASHREKYKGAGNPNAKLTQKQTERLLFLYAKGWTQVALGNRFGIRQGAVSKVINRNKEY